MLTKAQARSAIREAIDDLNAKRWSDAALDALISRTIDGLWNDVLEQAPWSLSQHQEPLVTAPGYVDLRQTVMGGQLTQRFFRLQNVVRDGTTYKEANPRDVTRENDEIVSAPHNRYTIFGNQLWLFPLSVTANVELDYSFLPASFTSLAESGFVPWPDGYDDAYIYSVARRGFAKGDAESITQATELASEAVNKLKAAIKKSSTGPGGGPWSPFTARESGGV